MLGMKSLLYYQAIEFLVWVQAGGREEEECHENLKYIPLPYYSITKYKHTASIFFRSDQTLLRKGREREYSDTGSQSSVLEIQTHRSLGESRYAPIADINSVPSKTIFLQVLKRAF